ncbi:hypothetical protein MASR2M15_11180 [Anaerolineales bacterium]
MQDYSEQRRRKERKARERHLARQRRKESVQDKFDWMLAFLPTIDRAALPSWVQKIATTMEDAWWYIRRRTQLLRYLWLIPIMMIVLFVISLATSTNIHANIWSMDVNLGGLSLAEAEIKLLDAWTNNIKIDLYLEGELYRSVRPSEMGLQLNAKETALLAQEAGISGIPFGVDIQPVVDFQYGSAQAFLLKVLDDIYIPPYDAGFEWVNNTLISIEGSASRELDLSLTLDRLAASPEAVSQGKRFDLVTKSTLPDIIDATEFVDDAEDYLNQEFFLTGYDLFLDQSIPWTTAREEVTRWLTANEDGIALREETFETFIRLVNSTLEESGRYIDVDEAVELMSEALANESSQINLRLRYTPSSYEIVAADTGFRIGRKTGLPFTLIQEANPGINWNSLSIGQKINLPSKDLVTPFEPAIGKRIIVDLDSQYMVAYDKGEMLFHWPISSGMPQAPTSPGVFQITSHEDVTRGSSVTLCNDQGVCGEWEMYWFMGIYDIAPNLTNGFHGAVLLPNGAYLGGGGVTQPSTFGCVMSENSNAQLLYEWADIGTTVEILSYEFPPQSDLGSQALDFIRSNNF